MTRGSRGRAEFRPKPEVAGPIAALADGLDPLAGQQRSASVRTGIAATSATVYAVLPAQLLGGLAVMVRAELKFSEAALGALIAIFFAASATSGLIGGRVAEWLGARRAIQAASLITALAFAGVATVTHDWLMLAICLGIAGMGNGVGQPAANLALARGVPQRRMGFAFGLKASAVPMAGLLAGVSVPLLGLTIGWRWAFAAAGMLGLLFVLSMQTDVGAAVQLRRAKRRRADIPLTPLAMIMVGWGAGAAAGGALSVFFVESSVTAGHSVGFAGALLALGSLSAVSVRLVVGWRADRHRGRPIIGAAIMLIVGSLGFVLLAFAADHVLVQAVGTLVAFGAGWGWPGLLLFAIVRINPSSPATVSGYALAAAAVGAVIGPALFGWIVVLASFKAAWLTLCGIELLAAAMLLVGVRLLSGVRHDALLRPEALARPSS